MTATPAMRLLGRTHQSLARFELCARASIYLRNQAMCIINYHLGDISNPENDGELALIKTLLVSARKHDWLGSKRTPRAWTALVLQYGNPRSMPLLGQKLGTSS